jgi:hypothetical protein
MSLRFSAELQCHLHVCVCACVHYKGYIYKIDLNACSTAGLTSVVPDVSINVLLPLGLAYVLYPWPPKRTSSMFL